MPLGSRSGPGPGPAGRGMWPDHQPGGRVFTLPVTLAGGTAPPVQAESSAPRRWPRTWPWPSPSLLPTRMAGARSLDTVCQAVLGLRRCLSDSHRGISCGAEESSRGRGLRGQRCLFTPAPGSKPRDPASGFCPVQAETPSESSFRSSGVTGGGLQVPLGQGGGGRWLPGVALRCGAGVCAGSSGSQEDRDCEMSEYPLSFCQKRCQQTGDLWGFWNFLLQEVRGEVPGGGQQISRLRALSP